MRMKLFAILGVFLLLVPGLAMGQSLEDLFGEDYSTTPFPSFDIAELKYDPYPAEPGEYMTLWIQVYNKGTATANNVKFELIPEYPFLLHPSETPLREFSKITGLYTIVMQYKLKVDKDAIEGWNKIKLKYTLGGGAVLEKDLEVYVTDPPDKAELKAFYVGAEPKPYPGGRTTLSVDLANIASGTAYYTVVSVETDEAEIEVDEIFIGTMDADDFDTIDFELRVNNNVAPGMYPVTIKSYYKDTDDKTYTVEDTVYLKVYSAEEVMSEMIPETPWWQYIIYVVVGLVLLKYFILPASKKVVSFFRKRKK